MTRKVLCQLIQRLIAGGIPNDDFDITLNQINLLVNEALAVVVKTNYTDNIKADGIAYVNNSFYTTYKDLKISRNNVEDFCYSVDLPNTPPALGQNDGVASLMLKSGNIYSITGVPLTLNQWSYKSRIRAIPNRFYYTYENKIAYISSVLDLKPYKANVRMISGGSSSTDLSSDISVPDEWLSTIQDYVLKILGFERSQPMDLTNDGINVK